MKLEEITNTIIQGDCLEVMRDLPDKCIDLVVTSPPYNLGNNHHTGNRKHNPYDDDMPEEDYQKWQIEVLEECRRVLRLGGSMFYNHKNRLKKGVSITPYEWLLKTKWNIKQELIWVNGSQNFDKIRFYPVTERIYWLTRTSNTVLYNDINHHEVFNWASEGTRKEHTRSFPLQMVGDIMRCFPTKGIVLDPYIGSGTTAVMAKQMGWDYVGIEKNPKYVKIANDRLRQDVLI